MNRKPGKVITLKTNLTNGNKEKRFFNVKQNYECSLESLLQKELIALHNYLFTNVGKQRPNISECLHKNCTLNQDDYYVCLVCAKVFDCLP